MIRDCIAAALLLAGALVLALSLVGIFRFDNSLSRLHAAAVGNTMGMLLLALGLCVRTGFGFVSLKLLLVLALLWITSPVASNRIAKMELALRGLAPRIRPEQKENHEP